jgi:hypothetical protein
MRVAIVSAPNKREKGVPDYTTAFSQGLSAMGHEAKIFNVFTDEARFLPAYEYIVVIAEQTGFFGGKFDPHLSEFIKGASLGGKKGGAFIKKIYPATDKALANLMRIMEREGIYINWSDVLLNSAHSKEIAKRITN